MCCNNCRDTSEPSEMPSSSRTVWVRIGGRLRGRPAIAAIPTAIMAPEIKPPGRLAHKNNAPPAMPIASVSSTLRILARVGMANAIETGIRLTPPYGKYHRARQMRQSDAALRVGSRCSGPLASAEQAGAKHRPGLRARRSAFRRSPSPLLRGGWVDGYDFGLAAPSLAAFLHSDMNFLRSLPWTPLVSASFEHSSEAAVRGFSIFFSAFGAAAGEVVCENAGLARNRDATASAAAREAIVIIGEHLLIEEARNFAGPC